MRINCIYLLKCSIYIYVFWHVCWWSLHTQKSTKEDDPSRILRFSPFFLFRFVFSFYIKLLYKDMIHMIITYNARGAYAAAMITSYVYWNFAFFAFNLMYNWHTYGNTNCWNKWWVIFKIAVWLQYHHW